MKTLPLLIHADSVRIPLPDNSVHLAATSSPYYNMRSYGVAPTVWGGDPGCDHDWDTEVVARIRGKVGDLSSLNGGLAGRGEGRVQRMDHGCFCKRCSAWLGRLGQEAHPDHFIDHLRTICREVHRVLRSDGLFWLNLASTYAANRGYQVPDSKWKDVGNSSSARVPSGYKRKDMIPIPWLVGLALQQDGWWLRSAPSWLCVNKLPESVKDRLTTAHEYWLMFSKSEHYYFDIDAIRIPYKGPINRWGGIQREEDTEKVEVYRGEILGGVGATSALRPGQTLRPDPAGRQMRTSDFWFLGLDVAIEQMRARLRELESYRDLNRGMLLDEEGRPVALTFPTKSYHGAHFATYNPLMLEPIIKASTSERGCCSQCGAPWRRIVDKGLTAHDGETKSKYPKGTTGNRMALLRQAARERGSEYANTARTVGWRPSCSCGCPDPVPATVLDPFVGSGSTLVMAHELGRRGIGLDRSLGYLKELARPRLSLDALSSWRQGLAKQVSDDGDKLAELPLFGSLAGGREE